MKTMKFLSYTVFMLFLGIAISSCNGDNGADGAIGPSGTDGVDGVDGNANVFASEWYDVNWSETATTFGRVDHEAPEITQETLDSSVVLIYIRDNLGLIYINTVVWNSDCTIGSGYGINNVFIYYRSATDIVISGTSARYVIIPVSDVAGKGVISIDYSDYYEVCTYYGINPE